MLKQKGKPMDDAGGEGKGATKRIKRPELDTGEIDAAIEESKQVLPKPADRYSCSCGDNWCHSPEHDPENWKIKPNRYGFYDETTTWRDDWVKLTEDGIID